MKKVHLHRKLYHLFNCTLNILTVYHKLGPILNLKKYKLKLHGLSFLVWGYEIKSQTCWSWNHTTVGRNLLCTWPITVRPTASHMVSLPKVISEWIPTCNLWVPQDVVPPYQKQTKNILVYSYIYTIPNIKG